MSYEDTKKSIIENMDIIKSLFIGHETVEKDFLDLFDWIDSDTLNEKNAEDFCIWDSYVSILVEHLISSRLTIKEKDVIEYASDLIRNLNDNINFSKNPLMINILSSLSSTSRTLDDTLTLMLFLYEKIMDSFINGESQSLNVSKKYYKELLQFLSSKDHDSEYSTN